MSSTSDKALLVLSSQLFDRKDSNSNWEFEYAGLSEHLTVTEMSLDCDPTDVEAWDRILQAVLDHDTCLVI